MNIAFLPIEIDVRLPDEQKLLDFCAKHKMIKDDNEGHSQWWNAIPVLLRVPKGTVLTMDNTSELMANRYNPSDTAPTYLNDIDKIFPEIPYMLNQLPYKELTVVALLEQTKYVDYHTDGLPGDGELTYSQLASDPSEIMPELEPRRYNILLTKHDYGCFFVSDKVGGEKIYPNIPKERPCHAIADRHGVHGADYKGPGKIMLAVFGGILDRQKHNEVVLSNLNKYRNEAIIYP